MDYTPQPDNVCEKLLPNLLKAIPAMLQKVASDGFANSELVKVYHPTPKQQYNEYRFSQLRSIQIQRKLKKSVEIERTKSYEEFLKEVQPEPIKEQYEIVSIFGDCIWDIFSNNHTVFNQKNESYDLGSFRGSGHFIADMINDLNLVPNATFDYLDFYMGSFMAQNRADLTDVYEFIFRELKERDLDWEYSFPHLGVVSFDHEEEKPDDPEEYDPNKAIEEDLEKKEKKKEVNRLQENFDRIYEDEYENARYKKPSQEVMAYFKVYGYWPKGHPLGKNK